MPLLMFSKRSSAHKRPFLLGLWWVWLLRRALQNRMDRTLDARCSTGNMQRVFFFWGKWGTRQSRLIAGREQEWLQRDRDKVVNRTWPSCHLRESLAGVSAMSNVCTQASEHVNVCVHLAVIYFSKFDSILSVSFQMWPKLFNSLINSPPRVSCFLWCIPALYNLSGSRLAAVGMNSSPMCSVAHLFCLLVLEWDSVFAVNQIRRSISVSCQVLLAWLYQKLYEVLSAKSYHVTKSPSGQSWFQGPQNFSFN